MKQPRSWFPKSWFPTFIAAYRFWRTRLTLPGKILLGIVVVCLPGVIAEQPQVIYLATSLTLILLTAGIAGWILRPCMQAAVRIPQQIPCGRQAVLRVRLTNGPRAAFDFHLQPQRRPHPLWTVGEIAIQRTSLAAGEQLTVNVPICPQQRGLHPLPTLHAVSRFPLQLVLQQAAVALPGEVLVTPNYSISFDLPLRSGAVDDAGAYSSSSRSGSSFEYFGSREYQPGATVRRWDYASWARLAQPAIREFHELAQSSAIVLVDTHYGDGEPATAEDPAPPGESAEMEAAMSGAASLVATLEQLRWRVESMSVGPEVGRDGETPLNVLIERLALADISAERQLEHSVATWEQRCHPGVLVFFVTSRWDSPREAACRRLRETADIRPVRCRPLSSSAGCARLEAVGWGD